MPLKKQSGEPRRKTPDIDLRLSHTCTHMCTCIYANKCAHMHTPHTNTDCAVIAPNAWSPLPLQPGIFLKELFPVKQNYQLSKKKFMRRKIHTIVKS